MEHGRALEHFGSSEVSSYLHCFPPHPALKSDVSQALDDIPERGPGDRIQDHHCTSHFQSKCFREAKKSQRWGVGQNSAESSGKNPGPVSWVAISIGKGVFQLLCPGSLVSPSQSHHTTSLRHVTSESQLWGQASSPDVLSSVIIF